MLNKKIITKILIYSLILFLGTGSFLYSKNMVIPIKGEIEPSLIKYLKRALSEATNSSPSNIIFEIDTFGGRVDTTYEIVDMISALKYPTISVIEKKAISAGTLIAMSSQKLYMKKNTTIGDVAPIISGQNGPQVLGEKFQSPLRAKFRALAQKNGYPIKLSEAFVTDSIEIIEITWKNNKTEILTGTEYNDLLENELKKIKKKKTIVAKGQLLTMSDQEAFKLGFSKGSINNLKEVLDNNQEIVYLNKKNSEKALTVVVRYGWLLLLIGLCGVYLEVKNPGFGFYGILAIVAFSTFFLGNYIVELANYTEFLILIAGMILLFVEFFIIPGFGFIGVGGFVLLFISSLLMMQNFTIPKNFIELNTFQANFTKILFVFVSSGILFLLSFLAFPKIFKKSPLIFNKKLAGDAITLEKTTSFLINKSGESITDLRPSGSVEIDNKFYDAITQGEYIKKGKTVKVLELKGNSLVVEESKNFRS